MTQHGSSEYFNESLEAILCGLTYFSTSGLLYLVVLLAKESITMLLLLTF